MRHIYNTAAKVAALTVLLFAGACQKERCKEENPALSFSEYIYEPKPAGSTKVADTLVVKYAFEDCQGDIGVFDNSRNLHTQLYELINGEWELYVPEDSAGSDLFSSSIPTSPKVKKGIKAEGFIEQRFGSIRQNSDTIRFETQLFDREGNASGLVTTPVFVIPQ